MISPAGHYEPVAREGYWFIIPSFFMSLVAWWFSFPWLSIVFLVLSVVIALFFRNPERTPPDEEGIVVSPADGTVMQIVENAKSDNTDASPLTRMSIFMSVFNVHVNRWPVSGTVKKVTYTAGKFLDARQPASSQINEHNSIVIAHDEGEIEVVQIAGLIARRIACWAQQGDRAVQGQRFGLIRFGSRLDVYVPERFTFVVTPGTRVRAGQTVIARRDVIPKGRG